MEESINKTNKVIFDTQAQSCDIMNAIIKETMEENKSPKTQAEVDKYLQEHPVKNAMNVIDIENCLETDGLKLPENVVINSNGIGSIQFIQWYEKPQYPKTYIECAKSLECFGAAHIDGYKCELLEKLQELLIYRDAYWKIAGDWKPDLQMGKKKWSLMNKENRIIKVTTEESNRILAFPTEEMRDAFYENFKDLIEQCKELL